MKHLVVAIAAAFIATAPVLANPDVSNRYDHWEQRLRQRVNDLHTYPEAASGVTGDVLVGFRVGPDGKPTDIVVRKSSGLTIFDQAAVQLVSHLGRLGQVPSADAKDHEIMLKLSYGDGSSAAESMRLTKADWIERAETEKRARLLVSPPLQANDGSARTEAGQ